MSKPTSDEETERLELIADILGDARMVVPDAAQETPAPAADESAD